MAQIPSNQRPPSMSQLDWLWTTYRDYNVSDELPSSASSSLLLTDKAIRQLITGASGGAVTKLLLLDNQYDETLYNLCGYDADGTMITYVSIPKADSVKSLSVRHVTEEDGDCGYEVGTKVLVLAVSSVRTKEDGTYESFTTDYMVSCGELLGGLVSSDEGNLITIGSDGGLYAAVEWNEMQ